MHISSLMVIASAASAVATQPGHRMARMALSKLMPRQVELCESITAPYTCERSCGKGYTECGSFPNCYNPGNGETCCTDGTYCEEGLFCTDAGCCPSGNSLEDCGATEPLTDAPTTAAPTTDEDLDLPTETASVDDLFPTPTSDDSDPIETEDSEPTETADDGPSKPTASSTSDSSGPEQTPNAADKLGGEAGIVLGGVGLLAMLI